MDINGYSYLGTAPQYPFVLYVGGTPKFIKGIEVVEQSMKHILSTDKGSLIYRRDYGSDLFKLRMMPFDAATLDLAKLYAREAIMNFEGRVEILEVKTEQIDFEKCLISVKYLYKALNEVNTLVFPFYRN